MSSNNKFNDIEEYSRIVSERNKSINAQQAAVFDNNLIDQLVTELDTNGFVIIKNVFNAEQTAEFKQIIQNLLGPTGRHGFEGYKTQRIYSLLQKTLECNPLVEHPMVLGVLDQLLLQNYLLSQTVAINIMPGEEQQLIHHDDAFYLVDRPRKPLSIAAMWALDDFTKENGGTTVIPGSHTWGDKKPNEEDLKNAISVEMPAGSVCLFVGTLWHSGGANNSSAARLGLTAQYCEPWCRTVENCFLSIPVESIKQCSAQVQDLLGYSLHGPFMGYVDDARHPGIRLKD